MPGAKLLVVKCFVVDVGMVIWDLRGAFGAFVPKIGMKVEENKDISRKKRALGKVELPQRECSPMPHEAQFSRAPFRIGSSPALFSLLRWVIPGRFAV